MSFYMKDNAIQFVQQVHMAHQEEIQLMDIAFCALMIAQPVLMLLIV